MRTDRLALASALLAAPACIAPSVVESSGRAVVAAEDSVDWRAALPEDLVGFFESERIEGEVAASLARVSYLFAADGYYTGAALVLGAEHPEYQTLSGTWRVEAGKLVLDDQDPVELAASAERVRIATADGTLVLRRAALE